MKPEEAGGRVPRKGVGERSAPRWGGDPRPLGASLKEAASLLGSGGVYELSVLREGWESLVGPVLAGHCWPSSFERGALVVGTDDGAWASELRLHSATVVARGRRLVPGLARLVVRVGR
ncbi:MAG: DUF721 domain-containing protein [Acidimicrobiales bacterium]